MTLWVLGLNHQIAPVELRERAAFGGDALSRAMASLRETPQLAEAVRAGGFDPQACHQRALAHFSVERMAAGYLEKYEQVLAGESLNSVVPAIQGEARQLAWLD